MPDHHHACSCCDDDPDPIDPIDLNIRSAVPDPLLALPARERKAAQEDQNLIHLDGIGAFVRCLMPVSLAGGGRVTYSTWLNVPADQLRHAREVWDTPEYGELTLHGTVANAIKPWPDIFGVPARARVREVDAMPYLVAQEGTALWRVLTEQWDPDDVLSRIWHPLPVPVQQQITKDWSVERSAGLRAGIDEGVMAFTGPGRTVHVEVFTMPTGTDADGAIAAMTKGAPVRREGELTERDGDLVRHAFWLSSADQTQHDLYGFAAIPGALACATCMYDDAADLDWALATWRSLRPSVTAR